MTKQKAKTILLAGAVTIIAACLITFPQASFESSLRGLDMWWRVVFPSLLPFFIISELLIGFGVVKFLGVFLEPLMRPLFRVPGSGGFVWAMGLASGFPAGAKLTARLRQEKQITVTEAERLVAFTNASNPLFIFGAIAVGFFHDASLGIVLALSHYLGNVCVGLIMRFHHRKDDKETINQIDKKWSIMEAFRALHTTRLNEKRPLGQLLGDAVTSSINTLLMVGGFVILFSVLIKLLTIIGVITWFASGISIFLGLLGFSPDLSIPFISGIFEITLGSQLTSETNNSGMLHKAIITSFILAFNGFSIHAQVASILAETDIRFRPYFIARFFHGCFAAIFTYILWNPLYKMPVFNQQGAIKVFNPIGQDSWSNIYWDFLMNYGAPITLLSLVIYILVKWIELYSPHQNPR